MHESSALPIRFQPVPIHTVPQSKDSLLVLGHVTEFKSLVAKYVVNSSAWQNKLSQYKDKLKHWSEVTGLPIKDLYQVIALRDNLWGQSTICYNFSHQMHQIYIYYFLKMILKILIVSN